jgi:hypothetical protein
VEFAFEKGDAPAAAMGGDGQLASPTENGLGSNVPSATAGSMQAPAQVLTADDRQAVPWLRTLERVIFVLICLQLGLMLVVLPWKSVWSTNVFLADFPALRPILENYFVRGLVTGLGVVDLWLGIAEAGRPNPKTK